MKILTLTFDDGFKQSCETIVNIYNSLSLQASLNIIAYGHTTSFQSSNPSFGDHHNKAGFNYWRSLHAQGHEIMPHSLRHQLKIIMPLEQAKANIKECLTIFSNELPGFDTSRAIYSFPGNQSNEDLQDYVNTQAKAYRVLDHGWNNTHQQNITEVHCASHEHEGGELSLTKKINELKNRTEGWLVYNLHGLDDEGYGPISKEFLHDTLKNIIEESDIEILTMTHGYQFN